MQNKKPEKSRFHQTCPRKLNAPPTQPCPMGLEHVEAITNHEGERRKPGAEKIGCPWGIASADHGYCFWTYAQTLDSPVSDKEIGSLLGVSKAMLESTLSKALNKLRNLKDTEELQELREVILDSIAAKDKEETVSVPDQIQAEFKSVLANDDEGSDSPPKRKKKPDKSMPDHKDGRKKDLYGLSKRDK